jgi:hypothetical protein
VTGAEVGIAGGSAVVGQKVLEAVFGDQAVRRLALNARRDLATRVDALMDQERQRFIDRLGQVLDVQRPDRPRALRRRRTPPHDVVGDRLRLGWRGCRRAADLAGHPAAPPRHA